MANVSVISDITELYHNATFNVNESRAEYSDHTKLNLKNH